jgi:hypothetical protein
MGGRDGALTGILRELIRSKKYGSITLPHRDFIWANCPEPGVHRFKPPSKAPSILLLEKRARMISMSD